MGPPTSLASNPAGWQPAGRVRQGYLTSVCGSLKAANDEKQSSSTRFRMELPEKNKPFSRTELLGLAATIRCHTSSNNGQTQQREGARLRHNLEYERRLRDVHFAEVRGHLDRATRIY
jgi:hypothetical protein